MSRGRYSIDRTITARMIKGISRLGLVAALFVTALLVAAPTVQAITYDFTTDHCTGGCGTAPFGSVTLTQDGGNVDVLAHLNDPNAWVKTGAGDFQAFLFNGIGITVADITIDAHTPSLSADIGPFHANGSGDWDFGINCPTCANGGGSGTFTGDILFHVANAVISDLIIANATGNIFAADILGGNSNTGVVSVPGTSTTSGSTSSSRTSGAAPAARAAAARVAARAAGTTGSTSSTSSSTTRRQHQQHEQQHSGDSTSSTTTGHSLNRHEYDRRHE